VNEIQEVYRLQGVKINDKHIEVIVRQMLRKAYVVSSGESSFIKGEQIEWNAYLEECDRMDAQGLVRPTVQRELVGYYESVACDRELHFCCVIPGNHSCADGSGR
jgi:DNA-directed RNA polymerase subunit beta'